MCFKASLGVTGRANTQACEEEERGCGFQEARWGVGIQERWGQTGGSLERVQLGPQGLPVKRLVCVGEGS